MAFRTIRQIDGACRSLENRALSNELESSGIAREWCGKASPVEQEMDDSGDFERYGDIATVDFYGMISGGAHTCPSAQPLNVLLASYNNYPYWPLRITSE